MGQRPATHSGTCGCCTERGSELRAADAVVHAVEAERLAGPQTVEDGETLVEQLGAHPRVGLLAEGGELRLPAAAQPDAEREAPAAQRVQGDRLARHLPRPATRQRRDHDPQPHPLRADRHPRHRDPRIGRGQRGVLLARDVVPHEDAVPAGRLCLGGELHEQARLAYSRTLGRPTANLSTPRSFQRAPSTLGP